MPSLSLFDRTETDVKVLSLGKIERHTDLQPRATLDTRVIEEYADAMREGAIFPPVAVFFDGDRYWLADGYHRVAAAEQVGYVETNADVRTGQRRDAVLHAAGANAAHGLRRTNADKRRAVEMLLRDDEWKGWSDREIARLCGVGHPFVGVVRAEVVSDTTSTRRGADGKNYPVTRKQLEPEKDRPAFVCGACNEIFSEKVWHCPRCDHHWLMHDTECRNCHLESRPRRNSVLVADKADATLDEFFPPPLTIASPNGDQEPAPPFADEPAAAGISTVRSYITLEKWKEMHPDLQRTVLDEIAAGIGVGASDKQFNKQASTSIEWAQWSWNPITGCKHDCSYCYARDIANRFYEQKFEPSLLPERFAAAANTTVPPKAADDIAFKNVFACSMADLFGRWVPAEWIEAVLNVVRENPQWNFLFLTKFPKRYAEFEFPSNAWLGTTVDCQARVKSAEEAFARIGGGTKWLSVEPLLEPLRFSRLDLFDWLVIGGASASSQTPAWVPPIDWIADLHAQGRVAGCRIYYKDNCGMTDALRIREFPWEEPKEKVLPEAFRYLPEIGKSTLDWKAVSADPDIGAVDRAVIERNGLTIGQAVGAAARIASVARQGGLSWEKRVDVACRLNVK